MATNSAVDHYTDLQVRLFAWQEAAQSYPTEATLGDDSRFEGTLRLDRAALTGLELDARSYGQALFNALFAGPLRTAYDRALGEAAVATDGRLRLRLWIDDAAVELHALAWERLYHPWRGQMIPLATSTQTPFSRYTSLETAEFSPVAERPLRLLMALANPSDLPAGLKPVPVEAEVESLRQAVSALCQKGQLQATLLPGRSGLPAALRARLQAEGWQILEGATSLENLIRHLPGVHLFHFVGHGFFQRQGEHGAGQAALYLEKDDGAGALQIVKEADLVGRLAALGRLPHLMFLMACESAARDARAEHPFVGLGPRLVQAGVPAVVAMQAQVPMAMSQPFTGEFYRRLAEHGEVDKAMSQARLLVFKPDRTDWAVPVLFMRLRAGRLFVPLAEKASSLKAKEETVSKKVVHQSGGVNIGGKGNVTIGGDVVGRDKIVSNVNTSTGVDAGQMVELLKQFAAINRQIDALSGKDDDEKQELKETVKKIEDEVKKGDQAKPEKVERWLKFIATMTDDIFEVVTNTLANPIYGLATVVRNVAKKAKEKPGA